MGGAGKHSERTHLDRLFREGVAGGLEDGRLIERYLAGGGESAHAAFGTLVERHGSMVLRVCRLTLEDTPDAEDAFQATFLVLARRAGSVRRRDSLGAWLFGVAIRIARRARRDAARRRAHERRRSGMTPEALDTVKPDAARLELYEELGRLPARLRDALVLCHLEGLPLAEAAARLGVPVRTLQRRLADGRDRLRVRLGRLGVAAPVRLADALASGDRCLPATLASVTTKAAVAFGTGRAAATSQAGVWAKAALWAIRGARLTPLAAIAGCLIGVTLTALGFARPVPDEPPQAPPTVPRIPVGRAFVAGTPARAQRHAVDLTILDDADGRPVPGARVHVTEYVTLTPHAFEADAGGRLRVEYPTIVEQAAVFEVRKEGYIPKRHTFGRIGERAYNPLDGPLTVRLRAATTVGGTVVDEGGRPVAGATVVVTVPADGRPASRPPLDGRGYEITFEVPAVTDADGRWRSAAVSPDASKIHLQLVHPGYVSGGPATLGGPGLRFPDMRKLRDLSDRQVMVRGVEVAGEVSDDLGRPIPGAEVVESRYGLTFLEFARRITSDSQGRFRFHFDPGEPPVPLTVKAKGFTPGERVWRVKGDEPPFLVRLKPAKTLRVRVLDDHGRPVPDVQVFVSSIAPRFRGISIRLWTDSEGRLAWDGAPDDPVPLAFAKKGFLEEGVPLRPADGEALVVLKPALSIRGKVLDAATGLAVPRYSISAGTADPDTGAMARDPSSGRTYTLGGEFNLQRDATRPVHFFEIEAAGYEPFDSRLIRGDEGEITYDVRLTPRSAAVDPEQPRIPDNPFSPGRP